MAKANRKSTTPAKSPAAVPGNTDWNPRPTKRMGSIPAPAGTHPDSFGLTTVGRCLEPRVREGQIVIVEPTFPHPGELAVIWFYGSDRPAIKILETDLKYGFPHNPKSEAELIVCFEQLNPPRRYSVRASKIERIARVHSVVASPDSALSPEAVS